MGKHRATPVLAAALLVAGCGGADEASQADSFPDVPEAALAKLRGTTNVKTIECTTDGGRIHDVLEESFSAADLIGTPTNVCTVVFDDGRQTYLLRIKGHWYRTSPQSP